MPNKGEINRPNDSKRTLKRLFSYLAEYKLTVAVIILCCLISNVLALIGPSLAGKAINAASAGAGKVDFALIGRYVALMAIFYIVSSIVNAIIQLIMVRVGKRITYRMRSDVFNKLMTLPVSYFDVHQTGDIISRVSYDIEQVGTSLVTDVTSVLTNVITIFGSLVMMIIVSPVLSLVVLVTMPLIVIYTAVLRKKVHPRYKRRSVAYGALNGFSEEMLGGHKTIQGYSYEDKANERFDSVSYEASEAFYRAENLAQTMGPAVNVVNSLTLMFTAILGSILYISGYVNLGQISSFVLYSRKFSNPVTEISNVINEMFSALAAAERVFDLLDEEPESEDISGSIELTSCSGHVEMKNVSFGYVPGKTILSGLDLDAKPGSQIAIVGPTGAGKTTIINLLMRFYDVDEGEICIDGRNIKEYTRKSLRGAYAMVLQDTWLFRGTIFENIAYGKENATMEEVVAAAKAAHIHSFIMRLPNGYDTVIDADGNNISKGQKQLLTIARAMLYDARILILDEATSNVDTTTERQVQAAMKKLMEGKTCFTIAHRLSTIRGADNILVIEHGKVVQQGTHEQLMASGGPYYELYSAQFK